MKRVIKIIIVLAIFALLVIDFIGLWKYKLSGSKYELEVASDDVALNEVTESDNINYIDLNSSTMKSTEKLFIKNITKSGDESYEIKGVILEPYEVSKDDYNTLRNGKSVEILGVTYTKSQIKSNNLILKSSDNNAKNYYIKYDTTSKKYILKDSKIECEVYKITENNVKFSVDKGTVFSIEKNGKTEKSTIENVVDSHNDLKVPEEATANLNVCTLTFDKKGNCTKIVEACR